MELLETNKNATEMKDSENDNQGSYLASNQQKIENQNNEQEAQDTAQRRRGQAIFSITAYFLIFLTIPIFENPLAAVIDTVHIAYGVKPSTIALASSTYDIMMLIIGFPASVFVAKFNSKLSLILGFLIIICGLFVRTFIGFGFQWFLVGSVISGIGHPFVNNIFAVIAADCFSNRRTVSLTNKIANRKNIIEKMTLDVKKQPKKNFIFF